MPCALLYWVNYFFKHRMAEMNWFQLFKMNILFGLLLVLYD